MGMIGGIEVVPIHDDALDYRDATTLWFWPEGYLKGPGYELDIENVKEMLDGFDQEFNGDTFFTKYKKKAIRIWEIIVQ